MHRFTPVVAASVWITAVTLMEIRFGLLAMPKGRPVEVRDTTIIARVESLPRRFQRARGDSALFYTSPTG